MIGGACLLAAMAPAASAQERYTLRPGDTLEIWVAQDEQFSRSVTVGPDGRLSLPLVGHLNAEGQTVEDLEAQVREGLRKYYAEDLDLAIMLEADPAHLPSIFVTGEVTNPGAYPYRPGMTVLHAVTLAGGLYRSPLAASDVDRSIVLEGAIAAAQRRGVELTFTIARLTAELEGGNALAVAEDTGFKVGEAELAEIRQRAQALLDMRIAEGTASTAMAESLKATTGRVVDAVRSQREAVVRRQELSRMRIESAETLVERGHMQRALLLEQQSNLAAIDGVASQLEGELATAQAAVVTEAERADALNRERRIEIATELNEARQALDVLKSELADNQRALAVYMVEGSRQSADEAPTYRILRTTESEVVELEGRREMVVVPGDLVEVVRTGNASLATRQ